MAYRTDCYWNYTHTVFFTRMNSKRINTFCCSGILICYHLVQIRLLFKFYTFSQIHHYVLLNSDFYWKAQQFWCWFSVQIFTFFICKLTVLAVLCTNFFCACVCVLALTMLALKICWCWLLWPKQWVCMNSLPCIICIGSRNWAWVKRRGCNKCKQIL